MAPGACSKHMQRSTLPWLLSFSMLPRTLPKVVTMSRHIGKHCLELLADRQRWKAAAVPASPATVFSLSFPEQRAIDDQKARSHPKEKMQKRSSQ